jgi:hypothetical protein
VVFGGLHDAGIAFFKRRFRSHLLRNAMRTLSRRLCVS